MLSDGHTVLWHNNKKWREIDVALIFFAHSCVRSSSLLIVGHALMCACSVFIVCRIQPNGTVSIFMCKQAYEKKTQVFVGMCYLSAFEW